VKTIRTRVFANDEELLVSLEALKVEELSKLKKDSVHFNYVRFKASPCVQYDGIFTGDVSAPDFKYFNFRGYLCRHPESKDSVVQIEFSNHSNRRAFSKNLSDLSNEFFEKMTFSKVAGN
jgi:triosephosphate isomerase